MDISVEVNSNMICINESKVNFFLWSIKQYLNYENVQEILSSSTLKYSLPSSSTTHAVSERLNGGIIFIRITWSAVSKTLHLTADS